MQWLNPAGAWAFLLLIPVLALYLLRKKAKPQPVASLFLWRLTQQSSETNRPFQKLKNQLLLWLQLLAVTLLALALMRPAGLGGLRGETALVFDLSASMRTLSDGVSRLEEAKKVAYGILEEMKEEDAVTVITTGSAISQPVVRSADHGKAKRAIQALEAEYGGADMDGAVALALAMKRELPGMSVIALTDTWRDESGQVSVYPVGQAQDNRSISSLRLSQQENGWVAFARLLNVGAERDAQVECYADGALCDLRTVTLAENDAVSVQLAVPEGTSQIRVRYAQGDALEADDQRYAVSPAVAQQKALLVTRGNVFLQKALALREGLTVTLSAPEDGAELRGYDLYLYDGWLPETLPEDGAILAIAPDGPVGRIEPGEITQADGMLRAASGSSAQALTRDLTLSEVAVRSLRPLSGGEAVLTMGEKPVLSVGEYGSFRLAALGFDLHESNLPIKADFPVLVQNLLTWLLPDYAAQVADAVCGQRMTLRLDARDTSAWVLTPEGKQVPVENGVLADTALPGLYALVEQREDGIRRETRFPLSIPAEESDTGKIVSAMRPVGVEEGSTGAGREWTILPLVLLLVTLAAEWEVSRRGA